MNLNFNIGTSWMVIVLLIGWWLGIIKYDFSVFNKLSEVSCVQESK